MNLIEFYEQTPVVRHPEIIVSGDRLFFDEEGDIIRGDGELKLIRSEKQSRQRLEQIVDALDIRTGSS
jgi:hypothetical protein